MVMYRRYRQMSWLEILEKIEDDVDKWIYVTALRAVSYTHLTLPTKA